MNSEFLQEYVKIKQTNCLGEQVIVLVGSP